MEKLLVKWQRLTGELPIILLIKGVEGVGEMDGVAVKCLEIIQNTDWEASLPIQI